MVVDGYVIGHIKRILGDAEDKSRPAYGFAYATPASEITRLLGIAPSQSAKELDRPHHACRVPVIEYGDFHAFISYSSGKPAVRDTLGREAGIGGVVGLHEFHRRGSTRIGIGSQPGGDRHSESLLADGENFCEVERTAILERHRVDPTFRVIPLLLEETELPREWFEFLALDFGRLNSPAGPRLERLLYAATGRERPPASLFAADIAVAARQEKDVDDSQTWSTASYLVEVGKPAEALALLDPSSKEVRSRQLRALALSKREPEDP